MTTRTASTRTASLTRRHATTLMAGALASLGSAWPGPVLAQERALRFILPNATGSGVDAITRTVQPALGKALGLPTIVDNQPGAGGIVGIQALARSPSDGMTLGVVSNNVVIFPAVYKTLPFDLQHDVTPIAICGYTPVVLVVNAKVPAGNHKELLALLKAKPEEMNYGSGGNGTILHLAAAMYLDEAGARATHVPYKGVGPMVTDLIGGQIQFATVSLPSVQAHLKSGALKAIGVCTAQRLAAAPEIPTFVEQGLSNYVVEAWFAVLGPKNMAAADVRRINGAVVTAFADAAVKEAMAKQGNVIQVGTPDQAQQFFRAEMAKYARLVKKVGLEPQ